MKELIGNLSDGKKDMSGLKNKSKIGKKNMKNRSLRYWLNSNNTNPKITKECI